MSNELVRLTTQEISKAIPITTSLIIAEKTGIQHKNILELIKTYNDELNQFGRVAFETLPFKTSGGIQQRNVYYFNEQQATFFITLMRNTKEVIEFKLALVKAFYLMKNELLARSETRLIAKNVRKSLTDSIKNNIPEGNFKKFAYSNYTKTIYKKLFGKTTKELKEIMNVPEGKNIRDYFSIENLEKIQDIESEIATILEFERDINEKELFQKISIYIENKYRKVK